MQLDSGEKDSAKTWKQNRPAKLKFSYKEQREYDTIDEDIAKLEAKIEKLDQGYYGERHKFRKAQ